MLNNAPFVFAYLCMQWPIVFGEKTLKININFKGKNNSLTYKFTLKISYFSCIVTFQGEQQKENDIGMNKETRTVVHDVQ